MKKNPRIIDLLKNEPNPILQIILNGHLYIEYILNKILENSLVNAKVMNIEMLSFFRKVNMLFAMGKIEKEMNEFLLSLNKIRNEYAHNYYYAPEYEDAYRLVNTAKQAGVYFKDDRIFGIGKGAKDLYDVGAIFTDTIFNTFQELLYRNINCFTQEEIKDINLLDTNGQRF